MQKKKQKQCNGNHFLDLSVIFNGNLKCVYFQWVDMSFFNRIRPDPGFVSPVRSDPGFVSPIPSDPVRSDPAFVNGPIKRLSP